jgi:hypothetical protein
MGSVEYDSGASLRVGIKTLRNHGACGETLWPYVIGRFDRKPPVKCYTAAKGHKIVSYHRISGLREMLVCLAEGYPFVFGFTVYENFQTPSVARAGVVTMPRKGEKAIGGHARSWPWALTREPKASSCATPGARDGERKVTLLHAL